MVSFSVGGVVEEVVLWVLVVGSVEVEVEGALEDGVVVLEEVVDLGLAPAGTPLAVAALADATAGNLYALHQLSLPDASNPLVPPPVVTPPPVVVVGVAVVAGGVFEEAGRADSSSSSTTSKTGLGNLDDSKSLPDASEDDRAGARSGDEVVADKKSLQKVKH